MAFKHNKNKIKNAIKIVTADVLKSSPMTYKTHSTEIAQASI